MDIPDLDEESRSLGGLHPRLYEQVGALARKHNLGPGDLVSWKLLGPRAPGDAAAIQEITRQVHAMEPSGRERHPGLFWTAGLLAGHAGDWQDALDMLGDVTRCQGPPAEAVPLWEAILQLSLETRQFDQARKAHDRLRDLAPWSVHACPGEYEVLECLRVDLTGVVWKVRERSTGLVRALHLVDRNQVDQPDLMLQIHSGPLLSKDHPAAERIVFHGKGDNSTRIVRLAEAWPGQDLLTEVATRGPIPAHEAGELAWHLVQGALSLHRRGLIHRGIVPGRILVWKAHEEGGGWRCRLTGADLVPKRAVIHAWAAMEDCGQSSASVESAMEFARWLAPESRGRPKGIVWQGPIQDVFGIGRALLLAMTGSDKPRGPAWDNLPEDWRNFLGDAGAWLQARRVGTVEELALKLGDMVGADAKARFEADTDRWKRSELEAMAEDEPGNAEAFRGLGRFFSAKESWRDAGDAFTRAIAIDDTDSATRIGRAQCHSRSRRPDKAEMDLRRAREISPDRVQTLVSLVSVLRTRHREQEALALLDEAIPKQVGEFALHMERGLTLRALDRDDGAEESFALAAKLQPANPYPQIFRARVLLRAGRHWEAAKALGFATPLLFLIDPEERASAFLDLAQVKRAQNNHAESLAAADEAAEAVSGVVDKGLAARVNLARILAMAGLGRVDEAIEAFGALCPLPKDWPTSEGAVALVSASGAPVDEVGTALDAIVEARPDLVPMRKVRAMFQAAMVLEGRGRGLEAAVIEDIRAAGATDTPPPHVRQALVAMLSRAGRHEEALSEVQQCLAEKEEAPWKAERRRVLARSGRIAEAVKGCNQAALRVELLGLAGRPGEGMEFLEKNAAKKPGVAANWLMLGDAQAAAWQWEKARESIRKALKLDSADEATRLRLAMIHNAMDRGDLVFAECSPPLVAEAGDTWIPVLVDALIQTDQWDQAGQVLEGLQGRGIDPNWIATRWIAMARLRGDLEGALTAIYEKTHYPPADPAMLELLADHDSAVGDPAHALTLMDKWLKARPDRIPGISRKALLLARVSRWQEAIALQRRVVGAMPLNPLPLNNLAWMLAKAPLDCGGDRSEAVRLAEDACRLTLHENPNALDTLAEALAAHGDKAGAIIQLKRAIALKSGHPRPNRGQGATLEILEKKLLEYSSAEMEMGKSVP